MKQLRYIFLLILLLSTSGPLLAQQTLKVELPDELQRVLTDYETYWKNNNAEELANLFTEDGFILRPRNAPTQGRAAIEEAYQSSGGDLKLSAYDYHTDGELGYILGGYTYGNRTEDVGKFTLILKKKDGVWLIHSDMDNGNN
ncbi:MAG: nuclear transport factor 2 family protein [Balneolaceae bacterium]|nr:nuclear transport factor 2 family protein [Balneolaceae bacterium]MBO6547271.1 nuclear transport factor 2 family protein [Balneolaceae bacterium]MBO6647782.1 nuclear transport factor 2 family protein [Balneolaceae bacterium]